ncbi:hypothetical protein CEXT_615491 [Caerostris extrusa]|uniref:Uncharacterized protein n=1 Tax=Caerostris extrusa TaxID=172846 RepID=A0AAV4W8L1_CAEEX|nr:hypothetical protein CEXT_615491 [Caerostris extrusa]
MVSAPLYQPVWSKDQIQLSPPLPGSIFLFSSDGASCLHHSLNKKIFFFFSSSSSSHPSLQDHFCTPKNSPLLTRTFSSTTKNFPPLHGPFYSGTLALTATSTYFLLDFKELDFHT